MEPKQALEMLVDGPVVPLRALSNDFGMYALRDHDTQIRYIGITTKETEGFRARIFNRHTTGSEFRSHIFSQAYNSGRMWRALDQRDSDAKAAKKLRNQFIRRFCSASVIVVQPCDFITLGDLEKEVQRIAPEPMFSWGAGRDFPPVDEPKELTEIILNNGWSEREKQAIERQCERYLTQIP